MACHRQRLPQGVRSDDGNIGVLSLGFAIVIIMTVLVVSAATAVHVQHLRLTHLADELALVAADSLDVDAYYAGLAETPTSEAGVVLTEQRMRDSVNEHLAQAQSRVNLNTVSVVAVESPDTHSATVTIAVTMQPLFGMEALMPYADGIVIVATGNARAY